MTTHTPTRIFILLKGGIKIWLAVQVQLAWLGEVG